MLLADVAPPFCRATIKGVVRFPPKPPVAGLTVATAGIPPILTVPHIAGEANRWRCRAQLTETGTAGLGCPVTATSRRSFIGDCTNGSRRPQASGSATAAATAGIDPKRKYDLRPAPRAAKKKASSLRGSSLPSVQTPEQRSTPNGLTCLMAPATLDGERPPARNTGSWLAPTNSALTAQSCGRPVAPCCGVDAFGLPESSSKA